MSWRDPAGEFLAKSGVWHRDDVKEVCKTDQLSSGLKMQELFEENIGSGWFSYDPKMQKVFWWWLR